jgi:hypothetical protein
MIAGLVQATRQKFLTFSVSEPTNLTKKCRGSDSRVQTTTVTVSGTGILEGSAACNYYSLHCSLLPRVTGNMCIQYEPSDIVVPDIDSLISKGEFDTLNSTVFLLNLAKALWILMNFSLKVLVFRIYNVKLKALNNPSLDKITHL